MSGLTDERLIGWREAYLAGGMPQPSRADRWQVLRAGVAGLWEFEATEYWYAGGWCQLTGRNETGKSSLMALTTLIPWLADTSPNNIDTLGASARGKNFRYYVEPTTVDGDRRVADATTNHGWLWVEYGRQTEAEPEFFTTLGYFRAQRANQSSFRRDWVTVEGVDRVRRGIDLVTERSVHAPKDVAKTAAHVRLHGSATEYRQHVAARLLGSDVDGLESIGKLLRIIRTPKLGQTLSENFVTDKLRDSLPGLDAAEVSKLAAGWDELDKVRLEMDVATAAVDGLSRYLRTTWRPYLGAELRLSADRAAEARSSFDKVTRTVRTATEKMAAGQTALDQVQAEQGRVTAQLGADDEAVRRLRQTSEYRDARQRVEDVRRTELELDSATNQREQARHRLKLQADRLQRAEQSLADNNAAHDAAEHALSRDLATLQRGLDDAGLPGYEQALHDRDTQLIDQLLRDRTTRLAHLGTLVEAFNRDDLVAQRAEQAADDATARAAESTTAADTAWQQAAAEREAVVVRLSGWVAALPDSAKAPDALLDAAVATLPTQAGSQAVRLADLLRADWYAPHRRTLDDAMRDNAARLIENAELQLGLQTEAEQLRAAVDPVVEPPTRLTRRTRPTDHTDGAPLWRLLDAPGVSPADLAAIEAALTAMGLLDAWVSADGVYRAERDGDDSLLAPSALPPVAGASLADLLTTVAGTPGDTVQQLLSAISWGPDDSQTAAPETVAAEAASGGGRQPAPAGAYWISPDGRWRTPDRAGRAQLAAGDAELIGETTRQLARQRRLTAIAAELVELDRLRTDLEAAASALAQRLAELDHVLEVAPTDDALRSLLAVAASKDEQVERDRAAAQRAGDTAMGARATADRSRTAAHEYAAQFGLPTSGSGREALRDRLSQAAQALQTVRFAIRDLGRCATQRDAAHATLQREQQQHEVETTASRAADSLVETLTFAVEQLRAQLDSDTAGVLRQVKRLEADIDSGQQQLKELGASQLTLTATLATATAELQQAEQSRQEREAERDASYTDFQELLDLDVAADLTLELTQPTARTVEATRTQVAEVRAQVTPRNWPDDNASQARQVQALRDRLTNLEDLRTLEAGGRTVALNRAGRLPRLEVVVDATGTPYPARAAMQRLEAVRDELAANYDATIRRNLEELLGSTFIDHLRRQLAAAYSLVQDINDVLRRHPTGTNRTMLRIDLSPVEGASGAVLETLRGSASLLDAGTADSVRQFLRTRIEGAREASLSEGDVEWGARLAEALDYRQWWDVRLQMRSGEAGRWTRVDAARFAQQSGGARVVLLMLPLVATLSALYRSRPTAPHPFWLDEAFDGLDQTNRRMVLQLLAEFDFDVLLAGPGRLLNSPAIPAAAMYQVVRADHPHPGADLTCELWAGGELTVLQRDELAVLDEDEGSLFAGP